MMPSPSGYLRGKTSSISVGSVTPSMRLARSMAASKPMVSSTLSEGTFMEWASASRSSTRPFHSPLKFRGM
jgi:hypothetical protein